MTSARLVFPHQLFVEHLDAAAGTLLVLVEPDLFFRQLAFHTAEARAAPLEDALVRRRAARAGASDRVRRDVGPRTSTDDQLVDLLDEHESPRSACTTSSTTGSSATSPRR